VAKEVDTRITEVKEGMSDLQQKTRAIQQDLMEQEELNKRKMSVIIHGLAETTGSATDSGKQDDHTKVQEMLHHIGCDDVSDTSCIRLGRPSQSSDQNTKPRPVKLTVQSEAQKIKILQKAKNLKGTSNGYNLIFIHQDLTPKQREARRKLVAELKERQMKGELNLIIIGDRIVTRRPRPEVELSRKESSQ